MPGGSGFRTLLKRLEEEHYRELDELKLEVGNLRIQSRGAQLASFSADAEAGTAGPVASAQRPGSDSQACCDRDDRATDEMSASYAYGTSTNVTMCTQDGSKSALRATDEAYAQNVSSKGRTDREVSYGFALSSDTEAEVRLPRQNHDTHIDKQDQLAIAAMATLRKVHRQKTRAQEMDLAQHKIHMTRFIKMMDLSVNQDKGFLVHAKDLMKALQVRKASSFTLARLEGVLSQLRDVYHHLHADEQVQAVPSQGIRLRCFVQLMMHKHLHTHVDQEFAQDIWQIQHVLMAEDVKDVIHRLQHGGIKHGGVRAPVVDSIATVMAKFDGDQRCLHILGIVVTIAVIASILMLGVSIDYPWIGWAVFEGIFCLIFLTEIFIKMRLLGWQRYLWGEDCLFSWLDVLTTVLACIDLAMSFAVLAQSGTDENTQGGFKVALLMRILRIARVARLMKLLRLPMLKQFIVMITGLLIGVPWLFWVTVLLAVVNFILAIIFRQFLGPGEGASLISTCGGTAEEITRGSIVPDLPECRELHRLYGEEFFGTVGTSMFTVFRCMIGDCTTKAGNSLSLQFSESYGVSFDLAYSLIMVFTMFGLFNVITAIFVDSTMSGLKFSDMQKKFARQYEAHYVANQLDTLVHQIKKIQQGHEVSDPKGVSSDTVGTIEPEDLTLSEALFDEIMEDQRVNEILTNLDVANLNRHNLFDLFDTNNDGKVRLAEFLNAIVRLRGDSKQSDVAAMMTARRLQQDFLEFQVCVMTKIQHQEKLLQRVLDAIRRSTLRDDPQQSKFNPPEMHERSKVAFSI